MKIKKIIPILFCLFLWSSTFVPFLQAQRLPIEEFIEKAVKADTSFEEILLERLYLQYNKALSLPVRDWLLSLKGQYDFVLDGDESNPEGTISLDKLFPETGTSLDISYKAGVTSDYSDNTSKIDISLSQDIAANAFGKVYRLRDKIVGLENDIAGYQILEAYEDYMGYVVAVYYYWYESYRNLEIGRSSYKENLKLLSNIEERKSSKIALDIDVNKIHLQVLGKEKKLVTLETIEKDALNTVATILRDENVIGLIPVEPNLHPQENIGKVEDTKDLVFKSRTLVTLRLLEEKSTLDIERYASEVLPTLNLIMGYSSDGDNLDFEESTSLLYAGFKVEYPFFNSKARANYEVAVLDKQKALLSMENISFSLAERIHNILLEIEQERKLLEISQKSKKLWEAVVEDESKNYIFGKATLNDYIAAVNKLDDSRFDCVRHLMNIKRLKLSYLRLTDQLVSDKDV